MDELLRVIKYIKSCIDANIDCTITIDKNKTRLIFNALIKQIPRKTNVKVRDEDTRIGGVVFASGTKVHYCPQCDKPVTGTDNYCRDCGQALIW